MNKRREIDENKTTDELQKEYVEVCAAINRKTLEALNHSEVEEVDAAQQSLDYALTLHARKRALQAALRSRTGEPHYPPPAGLVATQ